MEIKRLCHGGCVTGTKETERNGVPVGIIEGYIATWDVDRGDWNGIKDKFLPGAFTASLERHREADRQIRLMSQHRLIIGGFPIETVKQDDRGLFGVGEINLDVQEGKEVFSLAKQSVLTDFSIGWENIASDIVEDGIREISEAEVWEGSVVGEPMNPNANITAVKTVDFSDIDFNDMRGLEAALKNGVKFTPRSAKKLISAMKAAGMLRDEQTEHRDGELSKGLDELINTLKEF